MNAMQNMRKGQGAGDGGHEKLGAHAPRPTPHAPMFVALLSLVWASQLWAATVNRIVAVVNDGVITEADVTSQVNALLDDAAPASDGAKPDPGDMRRAVLRHLIEQQLLLQEAKRAGITIDTADVLERLGRLKAQARSEEEFQRSLAQAGLTEEQLKERVRQHLMVRRIMDDRIGLKIVVSPQEVAQELSAHPEMEKPGDRVKASGLLVRVTEARSEEQARDLIRDIRQQLSRGADFAALAKRYSEDSHASDGGAMGWVAPGELLPELDAVLLSLAPGTVSEPIQTKLGFHLVSVEERRPASSLSLMEAHRAIYQKLYQQKFQHSLNRWMAELKRKAYIDITPDG